MKKPKTKEQIIKRFTRAAKLAMKQLEYAMPCTPGCDAWTALYNAVKNAKGLEKQ